MPSNSILNIKKDGEWIEIPALKGEDGFSPTATVEKVGKVATITITDINGTTTATIADGTGSGGSGEENTIESISVNGTPISIDENKNVDITVPKVTNDLTDELKSSYDEAVATKHTHDNKTVLDSITAEKVESWDKAEENIQSDWNETDDTADGFIKNKPTIPDITGLATETYVDNKVADYTKTADLADVATSGSYNDLADKPTIPSLDGYAKTSEIPSKVSELENDSNYLSSIPEEYVTETELEAKGYLTEHQDISGKVDKVEGKSLISDTEIARLASVDNYDDTAIKAEIAKKADATAVPSKVSELTNDSNYQTAEQVNSTVTTEIAKVVADAPESLNTLKEMSDWIAGHEDDASAMNSAISDNKTAITVLQTGKADKSEIPTTVAELTDSDDYAKKTDLHSHDNKTVLDGITSTKVSDWDSAKTHADSAHAPSNAQENVLETVKVNGTALIPSNKAVNVTVPTTVSELTDSSSYAKKTDIPTTLPANGGNASTVNGHTVNSDVPENAKFTDTTYSDATQIEHGLMSVDDKKKLDGLKKYTPDGTTITADEDGTLHGIAEVTVDDVMSSTSTNPVQNKVVKEYVDKEVSENVDFSTSTSKLLNDTVEAPLVLSNATRNLLNPTLSTTTKNGITCTNNGDGTYTLNGTATSEAVFGLSDDKSALYKRIVGKNVLFLNGGHKHNSKYRICLNVSNSDYTKWSSERYDGDSFVVPSGYDLAVVDIHVNSGTTVNNLVVKPMITFDLDATNDDFVPYSGYDIKTCGKNLVDVNTFPSSQVLNGITFTTDKKAGTITLNGTATRDFNNHLFNFIVVDGIEEYSFGGWDTRKITPIHDNLGLFSDDEFNFDGLRNITNINTNKKHTINCVYRQGQVFDNFVIKPYVSANYNTYVGYDNIEPYQDGRSVHIDSSTEFPLLGLKSFDGETNIISPGNVKVTYAKSDSGKAILDTSEKSVKDARKETTVNLLKPTLQTTTQNGITCTNNGDGTYTLNGTATKGVSLYIAGSPVKNTVGGYKLLGCPINGSADTYRIVVSYYDNSEWKAEGSDVGNGVIIDGTYSSINYLIKVKSGVTVTNLVFKPMLTTNLSATYDDFVPYTGDTGRLNGDVAELNKTVDTLKKSVSDGKTKVANAITDKGVNTATDATFDVMAENISKIETGGGELHGATLAVSTEESTLFGKTVALTLNGANVGTTVFASNGKCSFVVQNPGTYTITCGEAHKDVTVTRDNVVNKTVISVELSLLKIVAFATGTDEEIAAMIEAHYNNKINIADYWAVGDTRTVHLSAMSATGVGESHRAQDVQFVIGDFNHDDLATPINGHTKAAITLLQKDCLMDASNASNPVNGVNNIENGYMNSTDTNSGGWKNCARRTWCNNVYFGALPSVWQSMVKTVNKKVSVGNNSSTIETVQDKIFLAAEIEIFGSTTNSFAGEGTQYQYYKNATANRYKMPKWTSSNVSNIYWGRSPYSGNTSAFCFVSDSGYASGYNANHAYGDAPCLCI